LISRYIIITRKTSLRIYLLFVEVVKKCLWLEIVTHYVRFIVCYWFRGYLFADG